jgi:deoxyadenosine/deoxycytidine kinase
MIQKELTIEIKGLTNTGKSTLTYLIKNLLKKEGVNIEMIDDNDYLNEDDFNLKMKKDLGKRIDMLKGRKITIKNTTLKRNHF